MKILEFMKKVPLKYWGLIVLAILFITAGMSRADKKLYNMIKENIEKDIRANEEMLLKENERLGKERDSLLAEKAQLIRDRAILQEKVTALERRKNEIEARLNAVIVPSGDDELAEAFKKSGFHPVLLPKR
jgi:hypothetical protein